jgi:hypothetical protein
MGHFVFATVCAVYASNLLPCAHCTLANWLLYAQCMLAFGYRKNLLPYAQLTLANFYAQTTLAIATVCTVNASNLLPYVQCTLANCSRMRSIH